MASGEIQETAGGSRPARPADEEHLAHATVKAFSTAAAQLQQAHDASRAGNAAAPTGSGELQRADVMAMIASVDAADAANRAAREGFQWLMPQL
jgi:hypothetical protein